jgi:hypothetical protein
MQKGYLIREQNCSIFYMKTMLTSVAFRKHTKIRGYQVFRSVGEERKEVL